MIKAALRRVYHGLSGRQNKARSFAGTDEPWNGPSLLGHQEKGIKDFEDCLKINPYFMDAYQNLSTAYLHLRDFVAAEKILDSAIQQNPDFVDAVFAKFFLFAAKI